MNNELQTKLDAIKLDKDTNLKPEHLKAGITCLGVNGTYEGSGGGTTEGIKQFSTAEEMQADTNAKEGDLAIVYRSEIANATVDSKFSTAIFPETVVLDTAITDYIDIEYRAVDSSKMFDCCGMLDSNMFNMDCYTESGSIRIQYESPDGITYTRTDTTGNPVDFGTEIYYRDTQYWNDVIGKFIHVGGNIFEGLYQYGDVNTNNQITLNPQSIIINESISVIQKGPIMDYNILKKAAEYLSQFYTDELQFNAYIDLDGKTHIIYAKKSYSSLNHIFIVNKDNPSFYLGDSSVSVEQYDAIYNEDTQAFENETTITFSKMFTGVHSSGYSCTRINGYLIPAIGIQYDNYDSWRHFNGIITYVDTETSSTYKRINDTEFKSNEVIQTYTYAKTQLNALKEYVYINTYYGKDGVNEGTLTVSPSDTFADANAEVYCKIQHYYDNMTPRILTDDDKTIDKNIYVIPIKRDGTILLDTSNLTNMRQLFYNYNNLIDIPLLDTSKATNMDGMLFGCKNLTTIPLLDTSKVNNMYYMFGYCTNLIEIPLLNTSNVNNMGYMFYSCENLTTIPLLDTSSVTDMQYMFYDCKNLTTVPLLDTSSVTNMKVMFATCTNLITIPLLITNNVTDMNTMFSGCTNLIEIPLLNTSKVTNMSIMFSDCGNLTTVPQLNTSKVTDMRNMFYGCINLTNESLNNILVMCKNATSYTRTKTLKDIGLTSEQANICKTLSNYSAFTSAGWTTGY